MRSISAYEYIVGEAKVTKIFVVYLQVSGFPNQTSDYAFECCHKQPGTPLIMLDLLLSLCRWTVIELLVYTSSIFCSWDEISTA